MKTPLLMTGVSTSPSSTASLSGGLAERTMHALARCLFVRGQKPTITKGFLFTLLLSVASLLFLSYYVMSLHGSSTTPELRTVPQPTLRCRIGSEEVDRGAGTRGTGNNHANVANQLRIDNKVLIFVETQYTPFGQDLVAILESNRIRCKVEVAGKSLPSLTHADKGKFGVIVFERFESYLNMDKWNRQLLDKYCREYHVGIIAFARPEEAWSDAQVKGFPLSIHSKLTLRDYELNPLSSILRIARAGEIVSGTLTGDDWTVFVGNHSTYEPLSWARMKQSDAGDNEEDDYSLDHSRVDGTAESPAREDLLERFVPVVHDRGLFDGVQRVLFGSGFQFWLHRILFLDSLSFLSHGKFSSSLDRYVLVDIDDIFVSKPGTRMKPVDVKAMIDTQERIRKIVKGFRFNLGFSGKYYRHGTEEENEGDNALIENRHEFWWFGHSWGHIQAHMFPNLSSIEEDMMLNQAFARLYDIPTNQSYSVAPHHAGVFPVHEELYESWKKVWGIAVTSTEEYPHLRPARYRRGFIHRDIMVLPRQTCGLFTHTIFLDKFPGGKKKLELSIRGGELFQLLVYNQVNVFMTHLSNYGNDRLALYVFESVFKFMKCWTNLRLQTIPPLQLARIYFNLYPDEKNGIWLNPCDDHRHREIWSEKKSCDRLPQFLIVGPQKTGTTALYTFLLMHPSIVSSYDSPKTFEEVQFFNGKNYEKGLDWYMEQFPLLSPDNGTVKILFEKSANYFDSDEVPQRAYALLPRAKLICILLSPAKRAYSWYQHMRAHNDPVALGHTFYQIITADESSSKAVREIKHRCLNPGLYAQHIDRWLDYYDSSQLLILDGEILREEPIQVMNRVQEFLGIEPFVDYSKLLKFDSRKGFFCQITSTDKTKCLGKSKGRNYEPMDTQSEAFLRTFYRKANVALSKLLLRLEQIVPDWLEDELSNLR